MLILANTGFLFPGLPLAGRIAAAATAGFDGVEFHDEVQRDDPARVADLLAAQGLRVGSLNSGMGDTMGQAALPGRMAEFAASLTLAHAAAQAVGAGAIHVLSGRGAGSDAVLAANLRRALDLTDRRLLIEPICRAAVADYHLHRLDQALAVLDAVGSPRVALMFDWFHIATDHGSEAAAALLARHRERIGHVQLAAVPSRAEPGADLLAMTQDLGFAAVGLEYRPTRPEAAVLAAIRPPAPPSGRSGFPHPRT